jgi:hypothetical protein
MAAEWSRQNKLLKDTHKQVTSSSRSYSDYSSANTSNRFSDSGRSKTHERGGHHSRDSRSRSREGSRRPRSRSRERFNRGRSRSRSRSQPRPRAAREPSPHTARVDEFGRIMEPGRKPVKPRSRSRSRSRSSSRPRRSRGVEDSWRHDKFDRDARLGICFIVVIVLRHFMNNVRQRLHWLSYPKAWPFTLRYHP